MPSADSSSILAPDTVEPVSAHVAGWQMTEFTQLMIFLASNVLAILRRMLLDADKIASLCNNITYYILNPIMKNRTRFAVRLHAPAHNINSAQSDT